MRSYKYGRRQNLSEDNIASRYQKSKKLRRLTANGRHRQIVFTDEKLWTVQRKINSQNNLVIARNRMGRC